MATFNILGTCINRDIFGFNPKNQHTVIKFLQSTSPIVDLFFNKKPQKALLNECFDNVTVLNNFQKKCIINDYNKTVLDYFDTKADYFIIDLMHIVNTNLIKEIYSDGTEHYFTYSSWFKKAYENGLEGFFSNSNLEIINRIHLIEAIGIDAILDKLYNWLINEMGYKPEEIILVENKRANEYLDLNYLYPFEEGSRTNVNTLLDKFHTVFETKFPECHVIKMPFGVYADSTHPWGLMDLHFCSEYYEYLYECIDSICQGGEPHLEILQLQQQYSEKISKKYIHFLKNSFSEIDGCNLLNGGFITDHSASKIAEKGITYYQYNRSSELSYGKENSIPQKAGILEKDIQITNFDFPYAKYLDEKEYWIDAANCINGVVGKDKLVGTSWKTINESTTVVFKDYSIVIKHSGCNSVGQMQIIQDIDKWNELEGKFVTLSVYARCLQTSDDNNRGGTIALINEDSYSGSLFAKKEFNNTEWQKIVLTVKLPSKNQFKGLKVLLRSNASKKADGRHSIVEFCKCKLEVGAFPTKCINF